MRGRCEGCTLGPVDLFHGLCEVCLSKPCPDPERAARLDRAERIAAQRVAHLDDLEQAGQR